MAARALTNRGGNDILSELVVTHGKIWHLQWFVAVKPLGVYHYHLTVRTTCHSNHAEKSRPTSDGPTYI